MKKGQEVYELPKAINIGNCPQCGKPHQEFDKYYWANNKQYPKYWNERKGWTGDDYWDWEEVHFCKNCKIEYYYTNGAY